MANHFMGRRPRWGWIRSAAMALVVSVLAPSFCPLGLFAVETNTPVSTEHSGCHESVPAKPSPPAPRQKCCSLTPAQAQPPARFVMPAPVAAAIMTMNDYALEPEAIVMTPSSALLTDSPRPRQDVL